MARTPSGRRVGRILRRSGQRQGAALNPTLRRSDEFEVKREQYPDGSLIVSENPVGLRLLLIAFAAAVLAAVFLAQPPENTRRWLGTIGALLPLAGAALLERVRFEFDVAQQQLRWQRRSWLRARSGELAFGEIRDVQVGVRREHSSDSRTAPDVPAYFITLVTSAGPLRLSDRMYADESLQRAIAGAIRVALRLPAAAAGAPLGSGIDPEIARLAASGETIEAVKLARLRLGLDLTAAKHLVEQLNCCPRPGSRAPIR